MLKLKVIQKYDIEKDFPNTFAMAVKTAKEKNETHIVSQMICQGEKNAIYQLNTYSDGQKQLLDKNLVVVKKEYTVLKEAEND